MLTKRIIPCLDIKDGRVVKGTRFRNIRDAGDPVELASAYYSQGADELVFLDISASIEKRGTMLDIVKKVADSIFIPFSVGGGIRNVEDVRNVLNAGADKVCLNTAAVLNPPIVAAAAKMFGSQATVISIDTKRVKNGWEVYIYGGKKPAGMDVIEWAKRVERLGAGEILLTSIDGDGGRKGYDIELTRAVSEEVNIPIIASGGAGSIEDIYKVLSEGKADAALAASIFHYGRYSMGDVKRYLKEREVPVRL